MPSFKYQNFLIVLFDLKFSDYISNLILLITSYLIFIIDAQMATQRISLKDLASASHPLLVFFRGSYNLIVILH